jgi:hypothetical protein
MWLDFVFINVIFERRFFGRVTCFSRCVDPVGKQPMKRAV